MPRVKMGDNMVDVTVRLHKNTRRRIQEIADEDLTGSMSTVIRQAVQQYIRQRKPKGQDK